MLDIPRVSAIAHEAGVPLLVDATFTTPWLQQPFKLGADLVFHSATKFLSGHGTVVAACWWTPARSTGIAAAASPN